MVTTGLVHVAGEVTTRDTWRSRASSGSVITGIGYNSSDVGFNGKFCGVSVSIGSQSPDIAQGVDDALETREGTGRDDIDRQGAGDQGIMFGYATTETPQLMPLPIWLAHRLAERLAEVRKSGEVDYLRPDGKTQVTIGYDGDVPRTIETVVLSAQHSPHVGADELAAELEQLVIRPVLSGARLDDSHTRMLINPTGRFEIGGPHGDAGLTGRKIIVDTYGGASRHGGGAFSGKDPSKVDRSGAYAMRWVAKNAVAAGLADRLEVQVAYAIGKAAPVGLYVESFGTGHVSDEVDHRRAAGGIRPQAGRHRSRPGPVAPDLRRDRGLWTLRPGTAELHLGTVGSRRRLAQRRRPVAMDTASIARVLVDSPLPQLDRLFDYRIPAACAEAAQPGVRVRVPFRSAGRVVDGYIIEVVSADAIDYAGALSELESVVSPVRILAPEVWALARRVADRAAGSAIDVLRLAVPTRQVRVEKSWMAADASHRQPVAAAETPGFDRDALGDSIAAGKRLVIDAVPRVVELAGGHWVGHWAVTLAAAATLALASGGSAILAVPDYRDQEQLLAALRAVLAGGRIVRLDARQSNPDRYRSLLACLGDEPLVIVGNRSVVYAPAAKLALIAVWDDSDPLHSEPLSPYAHTRDVALIRQEQQACALVFAGHTRSTEVQRLVELGWLQVFAAERSFLPKVIPTAQQDATDPLAVQARIPSTAWRQARAAIESGPVLVQVARPGYAPKLVCEILPECRALPGLRWAARDQVGGSGSVLSLVRSHRRPVALHELRGSPDASRRPRHRAHRGGPRPGVPGRAGRFSPTAIIRCRRSAANRHWSSPHVALSPSRPAGIAPSCSWMATGWSRGRACASARIACAGGRTRSPWPPSAHPACSSALAAPWLRRWPRGVWPITRHPSLPTAADSDSHPPCGWQR